MIPVVTPAEMAEIDAAAPEPVEVLIGRAGHAVARAALDLLGGAYGRRVVVLAGKGNNGNDGRDAARRLRRAGVRVRVLDAGEAPPVLPDADLVVDAAFGTGFRGAYRAPEPGFARVLAVDIPSGVDGLTGEVAERVLPADRTVTFAALKPGLLLHPGAGYVGEVDVADIGLDVSGARAAVVDDDDVLAWWPVRQPDDHKWRSAVLVVGGSPGMPGAATLTARAAQRAGAGYVRLGTPGGAPAGAPTEAVGLDLPGEHWAPEVLGALDRFHALVIGPGLGRAEGTAEQVRQVVAHAPVPVVVDGDGLTALGASAAGVLAGREAPAVLTPHDGEFARLAGGPPGADRLEATRSLAARLGATVLLKGPTTCVAGPDGFVLLAAAGDDRLATAGTGDVLAGVLGSLLARGVAPAPAAASAAHVHGAAGTLGWRHGLVAGDLVDLLPAVLDDLLEG